MDAETKTCPYCYEEIKAEAIRCRFCQSNLSNGVASLNTWYRDLPDRKFRGVASAMAVNTGISVLTWRVIFIITGLIHGIGVLVYLAMWALTPFHQGGNSPLERVLSASKQAYTTVRNDGAEA